MPETSILIPTYNASSFVIQAVKSILNQKYKDYEILILDDGSTDDTEKKLSLIRDGRIKYFPNKINRGIVSVLNEGILMSRGKYIARMDADDILLGNRLGEQIDFLNNNKDYGLVGSWYQVMNKFGRIIDTVETPTDPQNTKIGLLFRNQFAHSAVTMRAKLARHLLYDEEYIFAEDFDLWCRFSSISKIANLPSYFLSYRWYNENTSHRNQAALKENTLKVLSRELDRYSIQHTASELVIHGAVCFGLGRKFFSTRERKEELRCWLEKISKSTFLSEKEKIKQGKFINENYGYLLSL